MFERMMQHYEIIATANVSHSGPSKSKSRLGNLGTQEGIYPREVSEAQLPQVTKKRAGPTSDVENPSLHANTGSSNRSDGLIVAQRYCRHASNNGWDSKMVGGPPMADP